MSSRPLRQTRDAHSAALRGASPQGKYRTAVSALSRLSRPKRSAVLVVVERPECITHIFCQGFLWQVGDARQYIRSPYKAALPSLLVPSGHVPAVATHGPLLGTIAAPYATPAWVGSVCGGGGGGYRQTIKG